MLFEVAILLSGGFLAAFVAGASGFGDALIASALWLQFFSPAEVVPVVVACFFLMQLVMLIAMRAQLSFKHVLPFLIGGTIGTPLGVQLLQVMDPYTFKLVAGVFLIVYGIIMLRLSNLPPFTGGGKLLDGVVGGIGGTLGGFAGLSGFIPGLWCTQRGWQRAEARGVMQPYIMAMHGMALGWLFAAGLVTTEAGVRIAITLPAVAVGCWIGVKIYKKLDEQKFRKTVLAALTVAGAVLLTTSLSA